MPYRPDPNDEPDEDFDYDDFLRREFPEHAPQLSVGDRSKRLGMWIVVVLLCLAFLAWAWSG
jgi:hypothetical protein